LLTERLRGWGLNLAWVAAFAAVAAAAYLWGREAGLSSRPDVEPPPTYTLSGLPAQGEVQTTDAGFTGFEADGIGEGRPLVFGRVTGVDEETVLWIPEQPYTEQPEARVTVLDVEARSGEVRIELEDGSRLRALRAGSLADIEAGAKIAVIGEVEGTNVRASAVLLVLPAAQVAPRP
jgi:hypothetical protein